MKKIQILLFLFVSSILFSQKEKTCTAKEESLDDLNSITKCTIESSKKKGETIKVSIKSRFRKTNAKNKKQKKQKIKKELISLKNNLSKEEVKKAHRFSSVDEIPTFNKCKNKKNKERLDCFNKEMMNHINLHFQYPSEAIRDNLEGDFWIRFVIGKNGHITNIRTINISGEGGNILNKEAIRVVSKLPNFLPGKLKGKTIAVKYGFPINFSLEK